MSNFVAKLRWGKKAWMRCVWMTCMLTKLVATTQHRFSRFFQVLAEGLKASKAVRAPCKPPSSIVCLAIKNQCSVSLFEAPLWKQTIFCNFLLRSIQIVSCLSFKPRNLAPRFGHFGPEFRRRLFERYLHWHYSGYSSRSRSSPNRSHPSSRCTVFDAPFVFGILAGLPILK